LAIGAVVLVPANAGAAQMLGVPSICNAGSEPSVLVRVSGLKDRGGKIRVRTFGGSPSTYFDKTKVLKRVEYDLPDSGPVEVCVPVPAAGTYAVDVRHDVNGNGKTDRADGGGASGNPKVSLLDILFKRKPPARQVQVQVAEGTTVVPITLRYF
jgi:uncharacterized protein (DUF2141 family)